MATVAILRGLEATGMTVISHRQGSKPLSRIVHIFPSININKIFCLTQSIPVLEINYVYFSRESLSRTGESHSEMHRRLEEGVWTITQRALRRWAL